MNGASGNLPTAPHHHHFFKLKSQQGNFLINLSKSKLKMLLLLS